MKVIALTVLSDTAPFQRVRTPYSGHFIFERDVVFVPSTSDLLGDRVFSVTHDTRVFHKNFVKLLNKIFLFLL